MLVLKEFVILSHSTPIIVYLIEVGTGILARGAEKSIIPFELIVEMY
jgi:hypothetical protein